MNSILIGLAIYAQVQVDPPRIEDSLEVQCWRCYQSPFVYRDSRLAYRRWPGYWAPRWQRDPYWNFNRYRQGW